MASKPGENLQREWDDEPLADELWQALQALKREPDSGIALLTALAGRGSALAMMYLGHAFVTDPERDQVAQGEEWLIQSAEKGSIEGRFQLALYFDQKGTWEKARADLETLAVRGYSPAMYYLGWRLYDGKRDVRAVPEAIENLKMAIDAGHLPSMALLSHIYRKERLGIRGRIAAHWLCLAKIPALAWCAWTYPNSDRLRPYGDYFQT